MAWGGNSANRWGRKPTHERGSVVWKDNSGAKPAPFAQDIPRFAETTNLADELQEHLYVGALWTAVQAMSADERSKGGKFPVLQPQWWQPETAPIKAKSLMIYSGIVRVDQREANGRIVSVPRHTFIAGDGRYIVTDFSHVRPVT